VEKHGIRCTAAVFTQSKNIPHGKIAHCQRRMDGHAYSGCNGGGMAADRPPPGFVNPFKEYTMDSFFAAIRNFTRDEEGITAIEYGLIAALIVVATSTVLTNVSGALTTVFTTIETTLTGAAS
jgi:pilus assembly protein Flp/PilA